MTLQKNLQDIDKVAAKKLPDYKPDPAASAQQLAQLEQQVSELSGLPIPAELVTWFSWHNDRSQSQTLPDDNMCLMSIDEALGEWRFFLDPEEEYMEPYEPHWFPIMTNGSGDSIVLDLKTGELIEYWHDEEDRSIIHPSLTQWAEQRLSQLKKLPNPGPGNTLAKTRPPEELVITISQAQPAGKNLALAKKIRELTDLPMMDVVRGLKRARPEVMLEFKLAAEVNGMARARKVRAVGEIAEELAGAGIQAQLTLIDKDGATQIMNKEDVETLRYRCICV